MWNSWQPSSNFDAAETEVEDVDWEGRWAVLFVARDRERGWLECDCVEVVATDPPESVRACCADVLPAAVGTGGGDAARFRVRNPNIDRLREELLLGSWM